MCAHYHSITDPALLSKYFAVEALTKAAKSDVWPGYSSVFIRRHTHADAGDEAVPDRETVLAQSDIISLHCPLTPASRNCICIEQFKKIETQCDFD